MISYLSYLLADISEACRPEQPAPATETPASIEEYFEELEKWLESEPQFNFGYYCNLSKEQFPPPELLTESQIEEICIAFKKLLFTWNLEVIIPDNLPIAKTYLFLVSTIDEKVEIVNDGIMEIEFCNYDPPTCPFNNYCSCREFCKQDISDENINDTRDPDALPF
jgi:hypothetical protein